MTMNPGMKSYIDMPQATGRLVLSAMGAKCYLIMKNKLLLHITIYLRHIFWNGQKINITRVILINLVKIIFLKAMRNFGCLKKHEKWMCHLKSEDEGSGVYSMCQQLPDVLVRDMGHEVWSWHEVGKHWDEMDVWHSQWQTAQCRH